MRETKAAGIALQLDCEQQKQMFEYLGIFDDEEDFMLDYYPAGSPIPRSGGGPNLFPKDHSRESG